MFEAANHIMNLRANILNQKYFLFMSGEPNGLFISRNIIIQRLEYLIKNENDLFAYNLDKNYFILNFFAQVEN